jgi:nitroreductase
MDMRAIRTTLLVALALSSTLAFAQPADTITLPRPSKDGGRPLMQVLGARHSVRTFKADPLPLPVLSNLLWAAFGVNRPDGHRTAPSARNWQEIDVYVALPEALYVYEAKAHALKLVTTGDLRGATGTQPFVGAAPLNLIYVADLERTGNAASEEQSTFTWADAGFIAQNVYLFCASEGLGVVVRGLIPRETLGPKMKLRPEQRILLAQTVGYPQ